MAAWSDDDPPLATNDGIDRLVAAVFTVFAIVAVFGLLLLGMWQTQESAERAGRGALPRSEEVPVDVGIAVE